MQVRGEQQKLSPACLHTEGERERRDATVCAVHTEFAQTVKQRGRVRASSSSAACFAPLCMCDAFVINLFLLQNY